MESQKNHIQEDKLLPKEINLYKLYRSLKPKYLLICSYTLDLSFLEQRLLLEFRKRYNTKICVVTSKLGLNESFNEGFAITGAGTEYIIFNIEDYPYAFHPKLFMILDKNDSFSCYVSGSNFTYPGMCKNSDAITELNDVDLSKHNIQSLLSFFNSLRDSIDNNHFENFIKRMITNIEKPRSSTTTKYFLNNCEKGIVTQVKSLIITKPQKIRIISPYYDHDYKTIVELKELFDCDDIELVFNQDDGCIDLQKISKYAKPHFAKIDRYLHAKMYQFIKDDEISLLTGSANCTSPGLLKTIENGNWECSILQNAVSKYYADELWSYYKPTKIKSADVWEFSGYNPTPNYKNVIQFNASLDFGAITITAKDNFPNTIEKCNIIIEIRDSDKIVKQIKLDSQVKNITISLSNKENESIGNYATIIKLETIENDLLGCCWLLKNQLLSRSGKIRKYEAIINQFRDNTLDGWDQLLELINFMSSSMHLISVDQKRIYKRYSEKKELKSGEKKIPTIKGFISSESTISISSTSSSIKELMDLGGLFNNLFEKGMSLSEEIENDDEEEEEENLEKKNQKKYSTTSEKTLINEEKQYISELIAKRSSVLDKIPSLGYLFDHQIIEPFESIIDKKFNLILYESMLDTLHFALKLIRFLRLELGAKYEPNKLEMNVGRFLNESSKLVFWFARITERLASQRKILFKRNFSFSFKDHSLTQELIIVMCEIWTKNHEYELNRNTLLWIFKKIMEENGVTQSIEQSKSFLNNSIRFHENRYNKLVSKESIESIIKSINYYQNNRGKHKFLLLKYVKYWYWLDALNHHKRAVELLQNKESKNVHLLELHKERQSIAENKISYLKQNAKSELGANYDAALFDVSPRIQTISEIINNGLTASCFNCRSELRENVFVKLKQFEKEYCPNCNCLIWPVDRFPKYNARTASDREFKDCQYE